MRLVSRALQDGLRYLKLILVPCRYVQSELACDCREWELEAKKDMSGHLKCHRAPASQQLDI